MAGSRERIFTCLLLTLVPRVPAQSLSYSEPDWSLKSRLGAEDALAKKIDSIRSSVNLPPLKRVSPALRDVELVCTAAITGRRMDDPEFGGLSTYETNDLKAETEAIRLVALGTAPFDGKPPSCSDGNPRRSIYGTKIWPRYSVIVDLKPGSTPEEPTYTVGVVRRMSAISEFFAPITFDKPNRHMNDWKEEVAPQCRNRSQKHQPAQGQTETIEYSSQKYGFRFTLPES